MSHAAVDHTADISLLQALTAWLELVPVLHPGRVTGQLRRHMINAYLVSLTATADENDIARVIRAADKTVNKVKDLQANKENLDAQIAEAKDEADAAPNSTRKQRAAMQARTVKLLAQQDKAAGKVQHRTESQLTKVQLTYNDAWRAAQAAIRRHRHEQTAEEKAEQKERRLEAKRLQREQRAKEQADEAEQLREQRETAEQARTANEERAREFNRNAAALNMAYSKEQRKRRNEIEETTLKLQKRLMAITAAELSALGLPDPAAEPVEEKEDGNAAQP